MSFNFDNLPDRVIPYIVMGALNEPVLILPGPFRLVGPGDARLDSDLTFRWLPSTAIAFEGSCSGSVVGLVGQSCSIESEGAEHLVVPVMVTRTVFGPNSSLIGGCVQRPFSLGSAPIDVLQFSLTNFPNYCGSTFRYEHKGSHGSTNARLQMTSDIGSFRIDAIPEVAELRDRAFRESGFVISHVGEWLPSSGQITARDAEETLSMLHLWFGLLRGAWAGPVFPRGLVDNKEVWRYFKRWNISESQEVPTWLPMQTPLDLSALFAGFLILWRTPVWREPLRSAISWFIAANSSRIGRDTSVILSQVALELLAWVHVVESQHLHSWADFKDLSAAGRIRILLQQIRVPAAVPNYLANLSSLQNRDAFDGPGVITRVRNSLIHSSEGKLSTAKPLTGPQLWECSQLALRYLELTLLSICGYSGQYAIRAFYPSGSAIEEPVPWK
jgi:hypothetical protein